MDAALVLGGGRPVLEPQLPGGGRFSCPGAYGSRGGMLAQKKPINQFDKITYLHL